MGMGGAHGRKIGFVQKSSIKSICSDGLVRYLDCSDVYT